MCLKTVLQTMTTLGLLLAGTHIHLGTAVTDPVATICSPLCVAFLDVAYDCGADRNCYDYFDSNDTDTAIRCLEPCWDLSAPCMKLCADNFDSNFDTCEMECQDNNGMQCVYDCFDNTFAQQRNSSLTVPSSDIGPFEE
ncbi:cysteine-rich neurotrophic factor-like [Littorina saxatilis]|uniref:cysteine-rich neurotrophic factor-like n=1 Tax=Littorina saxatilis TaxID=31220 RepID=UPI0038B5813C